jgi:hypothetical protein
VLDCIIITKSNKKYLHPHISNETFYRLRCKNHHWLSVITIIHSDLSFLLYNAFEIKYFIVLLEQQIVKIYTSIFIFQIKRFIVGRFCEEDLSVVKVWTASVLAEGFALSVGQNLLGTNEESLAITIILNHLKITLTISTYIFSYIFAIAIILNH